MKTKVLDFEILSHVTPNGSLRKYGSLEFQRQGCEYRVITPIQRQDSSAEKEVYQDLVSKLNKAKTKRIKPEKNITSDEAFRIVLHLVNNQEYHS